MLLFYICIKYTITVNLWGEILRNFEGIVYPYSLPTMGKSLLLLLLLLLYTILYIIMIAIAIIV